MRRRAAMAVTLLSALALTACTVSPGGSATPDAVRPTFSATPVPTSSFAVAGHWQATATPPLSPRYDALAISAGDSYFILGGLDGRTNKPLLDGARYDPAKDTWTRLPAFGKNFALVTSYSSAVLVGDSLYVIGPRDRPLHGPGPDPAGGDTFSTRDFAVLDLGSGHWTHLASPQKAGVPGRTRLVARDGTVFAFQEGDVADGEGEGDFPGKDFAFDIATGAWTALPASPLPSGEYRRAIAMDADHVLVQNDAEMDASSTDVAILDLATRTWRIPAAFPAWTGLSGEDAVDSRPTVAAGRVVWTITMPKPGETWEPAVLSCQFAGVAGATADLCTEASLVADADKLQQPAGGLAAQRSLRDDFVISHDRVATASDVQAWYQLYDPVAQTLRHVPDLPGVPNDEWGSPALYGSLAAGAADSVLVCFGASHDPQDGRARDWRKSCDLLRVQA